MEHNFIMKLAFVLIVAVTIGIVYLVATILWGIFNGDGINLLEVCFLYLSSRLLYLEFFKNR